MLSQEWFKWDPIVLPILIVSLAASAKAQETKTTAAPIPAAKEELLTELGSAFDKAGEASWMVGHAGSDHFAYAAKRGKKWVMVADGKEGPEFVEVGSPRFSVDGQHFAYRAVSQKAETAGGLFIRWRMVVDGKEGPEFEELSLPVFSPDGQHMAYRGKRTPGTEAREVLILDGKEMGQFEYVSEVNPETMTREFDQDSQPVFSPDGHHWAYRARRKKNKEIILFDGKESAEFEEVTNPVFSPDGQHFAYRAKLKKNQEVILLDGKETPGFDTVTKPVFSPDGRRSAYFAKRDKKWHLVLDGEERSDPELEKWHSNIGHEVAGSSGPLFSPDSQHSAYLSLSWHAGFRPWEVSEIRDSKPSRSHRFENCRERSAWLESPVFSPDGEKLAYVLWQSGSQGEVGLSGLQALLAVPNQARYADRCVVVDGQESKIYETLGIDVKFSPDSHHFAYAVHRHKKAMVVVDGQEERVYDDVIDGAFRDATDSGGPAQHAFIYIALEGHKFLRVTQPLP